MLDMKRDIILRLCGFFKKNRKSKLQAIFSMCERIFNWRNHYVFDKLMNYSFRVKYKNNIAYGKRDGDVDKVCIKSYLINLYLSLTKEEEVEIKKEYILEFDF